MRSASLSSLSPARRKLVALLQDVNFGRFENLIVFAGEPVFVPPPRVIREIKLGGENSPRPERGLEDFELKAPIVAMFDRLDEVGNGRIEVLEVKHGLPFRMNVEGDIAAV